jgi:O-antigen ligase
MRHGALTWLKTTWPQHLLWAAGLCLFTGYVFVTAVISTVFPPFIVLAIAPAIPLVMWLAPEMPAVPRHIARRLIYIGALLMPLWPLYLHIKLGPLPIITPTRIMFYAVTFIWLYEMSCVRWRRQQFIAAAKRLWPVFLLVCLLFLQKAVSVPLALGKGIAAKEFFRETMIWFLPFMAVLTYVDRREMLDRIITLMIAGSAIVALIAIAEFATQTHLARLLAPIIGDASWLQIAVESKIRDGDFRAQSVHTHPLSLGEHLAMIIPFVMYKIYRDGALAQRLIYCGLFVVFLAALMMSNSRGAIIGGGLAIFGTFFLLLTIWIKRPRNMFLRPLAGFIMAAMVVVAPVVGAAGYRLTTGTEGSAAARSSQSRITQIENALPKIMKRPLTGYGNGRAARVLGYYGANLSIDNYYLNLALDLGLPGPLLFLGIFGSLGWICWRWGMRLGEDPYAGLYMAMAGMIVAFAVTRSILSITANIEIFLLIAAAVIGTCAATKKLVRRTPEPEPTVLPDAEEQPVIMSPQALEEHRRKVMAGQSVWRPLNSS